MILKQQKIFSNYLGWKQTKEFRQLEAMLDLGISERDIFVDKCSGKNFDRPQYQSLKVQIREGDVLVIKSIDRLGRNYKQICEEWREITREIKANIKVLDMPVLDTTRTEGLIGEVISDIMLQLLSYVAEQERAFIKQRQAEGIKLAKEKGKRLGKPPIEYPENWDNVYKVWKSGAITAREAMKLLNLKPTVFINWLKSIRTIKINV